MKYGKRFAAVVLSMLLVCLTCVSAWAGEPEDSGMYNITGEVISAIRTAKGADVTKIQPAGYGDYYPGAARFTVTCPGVEAGKEYVVFVVKGSGTPTDANIVYINQQTAASDGTVTFDNVFPSKLLEDKYTVYVTGAGRNLNTPLATFVYHLAQSFALKLNFMGIAPQDVTVSLLRNDAAVDPESTVGSGSISYPQIASGIYVLQVTANSGDYVPFTNTVLLDENRDVNVLLVAPGDLNGEFESTGKRVGAGDMQALFEYLSGGKSTSRIFTANKEYFVSACDVNGDKTVNILDYQALYEKIKSAA